VKSIAAVIIDTYPNKAMLRLALRHMTALPNCRRLYTLADQPIVSGATHHPIAPIRSLGDYNEIVLKVLPDVVQEDHVLLFQWDGMPVLPEAWDDSFLDYDYVGAPWAGLPEHVAVGNGGFSLRSRKLLDAAQKIEFGPGLGQDPRRAEDVLICRQHRARLESMGIVFAPIPVAQKFSYETGTRPPATFGFHNTFNFPLYFREIELLEFAAEILARQTDMSILLIYLHRLVDCKMQDLLRLSLEMICANPPLATAAAARARAMSIHEPVVRALEGGGWV
jgi:hypothetical protein